MASAGDLRAGGAWYEIYGKDSLTPVLERAKAGALRLSAFLKSLPIVGGPLERLGKALAPVAGVAAATGAAIRRAFAGGAAAAQALSNRLAKVGAAMGGIGAAGAAAFKPAFDALGESGKVADLAEVFGLTGEKASRLFGILGASGSDLRDAQEGLATLNQRVSDAVSGKSDEAVSLFRELGVSAEEFAKIDTADRLYKFIEAVKASNSPLGKLGLLMKGVGEDTGKNLSPLLTMTTEQMRAMGDAFEQSGSDLAAARETTRAYALAVATLGRVWREVATAVAPALTVLAQIATQVLKPIIAWVRENKALVAVGLGVAGAMVAIGAAAIGTAAALSAVLMALDAVVFLGGSALSLLGAIAGAILNPYVLAAAAVAGLGYVLLRYTDTGKAVTESVKGQARALRDQLVPAIEKGKEAFGAFASAIQKGDFGAAWEVVAAGAEAVWTGLLAKLGKAWDDFVRPIEDGLDDVFGGLGEVLDAMWSDAKAAFGRVQDAFDRVLAAARQAWEGIKHGFAQAVAYLEGLWERFGPTIMNALEPIKPFVAGLVAPFVLAFKAIRAAWDGLDANIMISLTRLAKNMEEVWLRVSLGIEKVLKKIALVVLNTAKDAIASFGGLGAKLGFDPTVLVQAIDKTMDQLGKPIDIEARVEESNRAFQKLEDDIRAKNADAKKRRAEGDEAAARDAEAKAAAAQAELNAAIANGIRPGAPGPGLNGGAGLPALTPAMVPDVSVKGQFGGGNLAQTLGTGERASQDKAADKIVAALRENSPQKIGEAVAAGVLAAFTVR